MSGKCVGDPELSGAGRGILDGVEGPWGGRRLQRVREWLEPRFNSVALKTQIQG